MKRGGAGWDLFKSEGKTLTFFIKTWTFLYAQYPTVNEIFRFPQNILSLGIFTTTKGLNLLLLNLHALGPQECEGNICSENLRKCSSFKINDQIAFWSLCRRCKGKYCLFIFLHELQETGYDYTPFRVYCEVGIALLRD